MASSPQIRLPDVDVEGAVALLDDGALLLDVREPGEWAAGHAPQATHLPLAHVRADALSPDRTVLAICRSGNRSGKAADVLAAGGIAVHNVAGGMKAWAAAGLPVVTEAGAPGEVA